MTIQDSNVTIHVKDMNKSISFYESIGFTIKNRWGNYYAQLTAPGITTGLHPSNNANQTSDPGHISIGFTTANLDETRSELQKLSIPASERQEEGGKFLHFSDPDGTALYFIQPKW